MMRSFQVALLIGESKDEILWVVIRDLTSDR